MNKIYSSVRNRSHRQSNGEVKLVRSHGYGVDLRALSRRPLALAWMAVLALAAAPAHADYLVAGGQISNTQPCANDVDYPSLITGTGIAIGANNGNPATACTFGGVAIGDNATAAATGTVAIGFAANANSGEGVAIGSGATTNQYLIGGTFYGARWGVAIGHLSQANGNGSDILGKKSSGTALGGEAQALSDGSVALGEGAQSGATGSLTDYYDTALGSYSMATGSGAVALGGGAKATADGAIAIGGVTSTGEATFSGNASADAAYAIAIGNGTSVSQQAAVAIGQNAQANNFNDVALGANSVTAAANPTSSATIAGTTYNFFGVNPTSVVSVGTLGSERQVTNVAAGRLSNSSSDAINGSQLYGVAFTLGTQLNNLGISVASGLGGGSTYNSNTGVLTTMLSVGGTTYNNVDDALNALSAGAGGGSGWSLTTGATGSGVVHGSGVATVAPGATTTITAGNNAVVTQNGTNVAVGVNPELTGLTSVAFANGGPTISSKGVDAGNTKITHVAAGTASTDAVNVSQLQATQTGTVRYDTNADGSVNNESVTLNPNGAPAEIHNVDAGTAPTDGVNVGQLNTGMQQVQNWAKSYTDEAVNSMGNKAFAGVATAIAMASMPQAYQPNQSSAGVAMGNFHGQSSIAVGVSTISESGRLIFKANASTNTRGDAGVGIGAGVVW